jgi:superfamily II DNA helicase RecQ
MPPTCAPGLDQQVPLPASSQEEASALFLLRKLTQKPLATWTSPLQWEAIKRILNLDVDVAVIMATGSGKTMVGLIPTLMQGDVSVFVLPLNALILDYKRKLDAMNIPYDHFDGSNSTISKEVNIVLVSADRLHFKEWTIAFHNLCDEREVTRFFFDEAHLALTASDFRRTLTSMHQHRIAEVGFILLTGTCPPGSEEDLCAAFGLGSNRIVLRSTANRPELQYVRNTRTANGGEAIEQAVKVVEEFLAKNLESRALVFVAFKDLGPLLADRLGCEFYSADLKDQALRRETYMRWFTGVNRVLIATSALSAGTDCPNVHLVVHVGNPREMVGYSQEVSRGGRDGSPCLCILIPIGRPKPFSLNGATDHAGKEAMDKYLTSDTLCLRSIMVECLDGTQITCSQTEVDQLCSYCAKRTRGTLLPPAILPPPIQPRTSVVQTPTGNKRKTSGKTAAFALAVQKTKERRLEQRRSIAKYVEDMERDLARFKAICAVCLTDGVQSRRHSLFSCPTLQPFLKDYKQWKASLRYADHGLACWYCHVPQCNDLLHPTFGHPKDCEHADIIAPIAFMVYQNPQLRNAAQLEWTSTWSSVTQYAHWLNTVTVPEGEQTGPSMVFRWFCRTHIA